MIFKFTIADKQERYWWLLDNKNSKYQQYFSIYKCTKNNFKDIVIYGLIIGPFHWRVGINKNN